MSLHDAAPRLQAAQLQMSPRQENSEVLQFTLHMLKQITQLIDGIQAAIESLRESTEAETAVSSGIDFYEEVKRFEVTLIEAALCCSKGSQVEAAKLLKLKNTTLNAMIKSYNIHWKKSREVRS